MSGIKVIFWKEINDYFGSKRFLILFVIICLTGASIAFLTGQNLQGFTQVPSEFVLLEFFVSSTGTLLRLRF